MPLHLTNVATLPCETLLSENSDSVKHVVETINHKVVSVATRLRYAGPFTTEISFCLLVKEMRTGPYR